MHGQRLRDSKASMTRTIVHVIHQILSRLQPTIKNSLPRRPWNVIVFILIVVVSIAYIVQLWISVSREILWTTSILLAIMPEMSLNNIVNVGRAILVELNVVTLTLLKDNDCDIN